MSRYARRFAALTVALLGVAGVKTLEAQVAAPAALTPAAERLAVFQRAQRLVNDGAGAEGRALIDSLLNASDPRSEAEADALFWRASLAESWETAQRDYLRVMLEHERSPRAAAAMLRLAQGELARNDREAALRYLERLAREAPESELRAEAGMWQGRALIERGAAWEGCSVLRELRPRVAPGALELERQYDFLLRGCEGVTAAPPAAAPTPAPAQTPAPTRAPPPQPAPQAPRPAGAGQQAMVWTVQIAAFPTAAEARKFAEDIRARGYDTRVDGTSAPFRVRFGRYDSRDAATAAMNAYKQKERSDAFLAQVPRE